MDLEFTPGILDTPSLSTPNIGATPLLYRSLQADATLNEYNNTQTDASSNPSSIKTINTNDESSSVSSAEVKLSKIENELKQSFIQPRKPTESPFQKIVEAGVLVSEKNPSLPPPTTDDGIPVNVPSTAEVMNDIESFSKYSTTKDTTERDTIPSDTNHFDTSPTQTMGVIVSPKKKLLIRSQSHTEPASPISLLANNLSQVQKSLRDDDNNPIDDDSNNQFQQLQALPLLAHTIDTNVPVENNLESSYAIQIRTNSNGVQSTTTKQQQIILNNKRTLSQAMIAVQPSKTNTILLHQQPVINEVTSSDQLLGTKRQKTTTRTSYSLPINDNDDDNNTNNSGSDDQRKKQIRDSNREAARRCRERRRNYIEQLEGNLEQYKAQVKQLTETLARSERENTQLRAILSEAKLLHSNARSSSNESMLDFASIITNNNGIDLNSETTDGNAIQRSYITRNTH